ncbi:UNVERIFIED_CONTAM: Serine carboxypeptidase-like 18 [Sesamum calycinum]|uniref:Carboxypeptidase n=1 Tax=Sesamum calycinum TaxID=2727403 RepID=A0AAW2PMB6_9LAMI
MDKDSPAGTGFSYATTPQGYINSDSKTAKYDYSFLRKWLLNHPEFLKNRLYIAGESYGGKLVPMVALEIAEEDKNVNEELKHAGYIVGNSFTDVQKDINERVPYAHRMALISDELFENYNYVTSYVWANDETVQEALHIRKGKVTEWKRCNKSLSYEQDVPSVLKHHQLLNEKDFQALAYRYTMKYKNNQAELTFATVKAREKF